MKTIVVVSAEHETRTFLEVVLRRQGYSVRVGDYEGDVLGRLVVQHPEIKALVLHATKAAEDSLGTLAKVRSACPGLPVIAVCQQDLSARLLANGATAWTAEPILEEVLVAEINKIIGSRGTETTNDIHDQFVCKSSQMRRIRETLLHVAASGAPIIFRGETGSGKEILARAVHRYSPRSCGPFVKLNCAALPSELLESELFGYEKGAFTGAYKSTAGKFEMANEGTLLLDEIGDMDLKLQAKLLHVLQDWEFYRLGGKHRVRVKVRVLAATHCDLEKAVVDGHFREDLYYRLSVINIEVPPLRRRREEILPLMRHFLEKHATGSSPIPEITPALAEALLAHEWPGNVRELENTARRVLAFNDPERVAEELRAAKPLRPGGVIPRPANARRGQTALAPLEQIDAARRQAEIDSILDALNLTNWNRKTAASMLDIEYKALLYKMKKLGIGRRRVPTVSSSNLPNQMIV